MNYVQLSKSKLCINPDITIESCMKFKELCIMKEWIVVKTRDQLMISLNLTMWVLIPFVLFLEDKNLFMSVICCYWFLQAKCLIFIVNIHNWWIHQDKCPPDMNRNKPANNNNPSATLWIMSKTLFSYQHICAGSVVGNGFCQDLSRSLFYIMKKSSKLIKCQGNWLYWR